MTRAAATRIRNEGLSTPGLASFLDHRELATFRQTSRTVHASTAGEQQARQAAHTLIDTPVGSAHQLRQRLGSSMTAADDGPTVMGLPMHLRAEPLVALGSQLLRMPDADLGQALQAFLACPMPEGGVHPILRNLRQAAEGGRVQLLAREENLIGTGGPARFEVSRGQNIQDVARRHGIGGAAAIHELVQVALPGAQRRLEQGEAVATVARTVGIATQAGIDALHHHATRGLHPAQVREASEDPETALPRLGIQDPIQVGAIRHAAAMRLAARGANVGQLAQRFGIDARDAAWTLEPTAARTAASLPPDPSRRVSDVVQQRGIQQPVLIAQLERQAIDRHGSELIRSGMSPEAAAQQLGVVMPEHLLRLRAMATEPRQA